MKIVDVCEFYSPTGGGVRRYIDQKLEFAPRFGHDLTIIAPGAESRRERMRGGEIIWVKSPQLPFDPNYRMFWRAHDVWDVLDSLSLAIPRVELFGPRNIGELADLLLQKLQPA